MHLVKAAEAVQLQAAARAREPGNGLARTGIRSPWATSNLSKVIFDDLFGALESIDVPVLRGEALTIPAVVRGTMLVTSTLADCPLVQIDGTTPGGPAGAVSADQPRWMYATDTDVAPQYRMAITVDDLIMYGWSLWTFERDEAGSIAAARHVMSERWSFDDEDRIILDGEEASPLQPGTYALIKGPHDGILLTGRRSLRGAVNVERAWTRWIKNPIPSVVLKATDDTEREDDEIDAFLAAWRAARNDPDGAVAYVPYGIDVSALSAAVDGLLTEARNASAVDAARLIGIPAVAIDAGPLQTSLTYANTETANGSTLPLYGLAPYARAIGYALSLDTVCAPGKRIALDLTQLMADAATISRKGTDTED